MAGRGPLPKAQRTRERANRPSTQLSGTVASRVPALPGAKGYSSATRRWYSVWARSDQASQFTPTDWQRLHMLAALVDAYFTAPTKELMAEIRINEAKLGATAEDRQRLRWQLDPATAATKPAASSRSRQDPRLALVE